MERGDAGAIARAISISNRDEKWEELFWEPAILIHEVPFIFHTGFKSVTQRSIPKVVLEVLIIFT